MPQAARSADDTPTLFDLARDTLRRADGDTTVATDRLTKRLLKDRDLLETIIRAAVAAAVETTVEHSMRSRRESIMRTTTVPGRSGVFALASGVTFALLDMPLANGVKLRAATREQVTAQAQMYDAKARDMGHKARWLELIAQAVPDGKIVGDVLTDARAAELWSEVK
jgi:hypothetical protein